MGNGWTVGAGPVAQLPTLTSSTVGSSVWGLGPTAVVVKTQGPIVAGVLVDNIWSLGGVEFGPAERYASFELEPFLNYNFHCGWFISSYPTSPPTGTRAGRNGPCRSARSRAV